MNAFQPSCALLPGLMVCASCHSVWPVPRGEQAAYRCPPQVTAVRPDPGKLYPFVPAWTQGQGAGKSTLFSVSHELNSSQQFQGDGLFFPSTEGGPEAPRQPGAYCAGTPAARLRQGLCPQHPLCPSCPAKAPARPPPGCWARSLGTAGFVLSTAPRPPSSLDSPDRAGEAKFPAPLLSSRTNPHPSQRLSGCRGRTTCNLCRVLWGKRSPRGEGRGEGVSSYRTMRRPRRRGCGATVSGAHSSRGTKSRC